MIPIEKNKNKNDEIDKFNKYPSRPQKLAPIFSRKRAEIAKFPDYNQSEIIENVENKDNEIFENKNQIIEPKKLKSIPIEKEVKEMPKNPFDFIWGVNSIAPVDNDIDLKLSRKGTTIGGRVDKLSFSPDTFSKNGLNDKKDKNAKKNKSIKKKTIPNETNKTDDDSPFDFNILALSI